MAKHDNIVRKTKDEEDSEAETSSSGIDRVAELTLQGASFIFFAAFASIYFQIPGLYGPNGLLPVDELIPQKAELDPRAFWEDPNLFIFSNRFGFTVTEFMEVLSLLGMVISGTMSFLKSARNASGFILLYVFYLSIYRVGQTFMHFQWDIMLLEFGVLCVLLSISPKQGIFLCRWLLLRLLFHSGYKKLESGCPTWWGLTALDWHFESQCIPTPLAYYAHHLPKIFLKLSVLLTYISQMGIVLLVLSPSRRLRIFSGWVHILHQIGILATGNYNFFNLLTILLGFTCFDDKHLGRGKQKKEGSGKCSRIFAALFEIAQLSALAYGISKCIFIDSDGDMGLLETAEDQSKLKAVRDLVLLPSTLVGFLLLVFSIKLTRKDLLALPFSLLIFTASLKHFYDIDRDLQQKLNDQLKPFPQIADLDERFELTHSYGLFRRMTGVGGRPEVVVEVEVDNDYFELEFPYKPTSLERSCPWCFPHQPRLDWQMWFAALAPRIEYDPWLITLAIRLLQDSTDVQDLFHNYGRRVDYKKFIHLRKVTAVRMFKYKYHYTDPEKSKNIWKRSEKTVHLGRITLKNEGLLGFIEKQNLHIKNYRIDPTLHGIRSYMKRFAPEKFIWTCFATFLCLCYWI
ncbi:Oidioi.mRNA.OKI2018_I69.chr2.g5433.t1.cds [Oikopleura dioica]|uniref:Lipase maturation factor n=1 Tax=Oikopleura dioica TaxID=34765 RepID=A0ABN7T210_OIKDI|nr:Oidioi.mRNA.OKI2018_I69.chr2.g5433.t1.cds [Oikopleura dioica]